MFRISPKTCKIEGKCQGGNGCATRCVQDASSAGLVRKGNGANPGFRRVGAVNVNYVVATTGATVQEETKIKLWTSDK